MLPQPKTEEEFEALDRRGPAFVHAIEEGFGARFRLAPIEATSIGSYPVFFLGEHVVKMFSPLHGDFFRAESTLLRLLNENANVPAPELIETRVIDGWSCILMNRLNGQCLKEVWTTLGEEVKEELCTKLGGITRALHEIDPNPIKEGCPDWSVFLRGQLRDCEARQRRLGLSEHFAKQIPPFLASIDFSAASASAVLHTELMLDHVFVHGANGAHEITGLIDFEPAMVGVPEYEFAALGLFVAQGDTRLLRALMSGYGREIDGEFHRRVMGFTLLHRYSRLSWYLKFMPRGDSIEELAENWFGAR